MTATMILTAYVSEGRWVVTCPACNSGLLITDPGPRRCDTSDPLTLTRCGAEFTVKMPPQWKKAAELLTARPDPRNRNWFPADSYLFGGLPKGETVSDLRAENKAHGL